MSSTLIRSIGPDFILYVLLTVSISGSYNSNEEVERSSWIVQADVQAEPSAWLDCAPVLRVVEHQNHFTSFFLFFPGKVGVRGECVDKATAAKAERIEEDLEDVFHNCTRSPYKACVTS